MKPIGVFDSGIGGLTVGRGLREILPNEKIFYLGDTARVPYGNKNAEKGERRSEERRVGGERRSRGWADHLKKKKKDIGVRGVRLRRGVTRRRTNMPIYGGIIPRQASAVRNDHVVSTLTRLLPTDAIVRRHTLP